ncbi:hypothetical protein CEXT_392941 [Caerostris extrusa]|uniref:Uncharacterized protein n=1 Tax=Caerostris extrusa TaxID=172846 RepID=A0AAV4VKD0_CAEEX|nr:hypothetical protein CEXT_392941 [Caerostris extrusa]
MTEEETRIRLQHPNKPPFRRRRGKKNLLNGMPSKPKSIPLNSPTPNGKSVQKAIPNTSIADRCPHKPDMAEGIIPLTKRPRLNCQDQAR